MKTLPDFQNKNILILGLGLLGRGLKDAIWFAQKGANVTVTDLKTADQLRDSLIHLEEYPNIRYTLGKHDLADIDHADLVIRNAGVPLKSEFLQHALKSGKKVDMDEALFAEYCPCPIIGITGTRGKSTTSTLIYEVLRAGFPEKNIYLAGNIQGEATWPLIDAVTADDFVVLELSSWQLQGFGWKKISPQIAVFTNFYEDHLNSYDSMDAYLADKKLIYKYQRKTDLCFFNADQPLLEKLRPGVKSQLHLFSQTELPADWRFRLPGEHNRENLAAALAVGRAMNIADETIKSTLENFAGLEHRLEFIGEKNGIKFINDTTSTTPIAAVKALNTVEPPIILLAGGASKNLDLTPLAETMATKVKAVIMLTGSATEDLATKLRAAGGEALIAGTFDNLTDAVSHAYAISLPGDTILLSPGCASFGLFVNEFDRGNQFKKIVNQLIR